MQTYKEVQLFLQREKQVETLDDLHHRCIEPELKVAILSALESWKGTAKQVRETYQPLCLCPFAKTEYLTAWRKALEAEKASYKALVAVLLG